MRRREFLSAASRIVMVLAAPVPQPTHAGDNRPRNAAALTLFLCGDVMTGRGIDQILGHPSSPELHEPFLKHAGGYVDLAEAEHGLVPRLVPASYIWGDALPEIDRHAPAVRIVNLETAVTRSNDYWRGKDIHYRMHPDNVGCLTAARIECCTLANNHVLDWGYAGLLESLDTLGHAGIKTTGAGRNAEEAWRPAILPVAAKGRVIVLALGSTTSGIPRDWAAGNDRAGVSLAADLSQETVARVAAIVRREKQPGDLAVVSIHWGPNWGYHIPEQHRRFAHQLVDAAGVDIVHGHSSHHPIGMEVYRGRLILYGCGDFVNDYEGIGGYEEFRGHLALAHFVRIDPRAGLESLIATPFQMKRFALRRASRDDTRWLKDTLAREGQALGTSMELTDESALLLRW